MGSRLLIDIFQNRTLRRFPGTRQKSRIIITGSATCAEGVRCLFREDFREVSGVELNDFSETLLHVISELKSACGVKTHREIAAIEETSVDLIYAAASLQHVSSGTRSC